MSAIPENIPTEPVHPENWPPHPRKKMLMTPLMATVGALIAFFTVVAMVVVLPTTTFEPEPSENWRPLTDAEMRGRNVFLENGCIYCHSGFTRPQDILASQYYVYSRASLPGDYMGAGETPNLFGTIRTGPDLSQAGGYHPDDWHYAHYANARYTTPFSIMPSFEFLSPQQVLDLVAFTQARGGKLADFRTLHQNNMKAIGMASMMDVVSPNEQGDRSDGYPAASAIKNLMLIERGYWFENNPLPVTSENLLRGRQVFEERCIGCHGSQGDGNGPAALYLQPSPAAFDTADDQLHGSDTAPGAYYWRILRGIPGTAMENFGTRLTVDDIWKVVLFLKTIPNGGLEKIPTPDMYIQWTGYDGLFQWADCFYPESFQPANGVYGQPPDGAGDVPGIVQEGQVNPVYAVTLWEENNNARPCGTQGFENVTLQDILAEAANRTDGFARQGVDQKQYMPASMLHPDMQPPQLLSQVWRQSNPNADPGTNP